MTALLYAVSFRSADPARLAQFWGELLGRDVVDDPWGAVALSGTDRPGYRLRFEQADAPKIGQNTIHFDLTSATPEVMQDTIDRARALGGRSIDIGQGSDADHEVMADPDGNEFCVIPAGNTFLADTGFIGGINCDGTQDVGYFWSKTLAWPLVWDQDEETAIQSREGGSKVTWSGPPLMEKHGKARIALDLIAPDGGDLESEVERLTALGARRDDNGQGAAPWVDLKDPDGTDFRLFPAG
ncbi:hypothetical protein N802_10015 [Knoellia sinensis KCTC 19936]|uniref:VOC domain-containing protein n=1 Tax=Knoellia sinensis KCTC 19936 TaxID=1385520 RepID=A0A0A0J040_9MICO|nr:VOC family protein [Knoellia sinensis]KGN30089.1 hypothetical protein N802_10015 [Knoellia sinensis KCTC 19936]